ncbi:hypothetical protein [Pseudoalteromonas sp. GCY]|uniref:hypothetical protein n=1 Tax=Pseudoalteromonas sp. GCY TaxID=2003316 RepID=UPI001F172A70|nr:hypothetical protein [Pseudoalteromonas sp. GCY]
MSEIKARFFEQYHKHNLATEPYVIFGSGGGCGQILALIKHDALVKPAMIIGDKPGTEEITSLDDLTHESIYNDVATLKETDTHVLLFKKPEGDLL